MAKQNLGRVGLVLKGAWDSEINYVPLDLVSYDGNAWAAKRNNTGVAPSTVETDDWQLISNNSNLVATVQGYKNAAEAAATAAAADAVKGQTAQDMIAGTEESTTASTTHPKNSYFIYNGKLYVATANIPSGELIVPSGTGKNCEEATVGEKLDGCLVYDEDQGLTDYEMYTGRANIEAAHWTSLADEFVLANSYSAGDMVIYQGDLIRFTQNHSGGSNPTVSEIETVDIVTLLNNGPVLYNKAQTLTPEQKAQARDNIDAGAGRVAYDEAQTLTDTEQATALQNIGAAQIFATDSSGSNTGMFIRY